MKGRTMFLMTSLSCLLSACLVMEESPAQLTECSESIATHEASAVLDVVVQEAITDGLTGVALSVISESKGAYLKGFGMADLKSGEAMQACHKFRVASLTKVMTATATLILVNNGAISLETVVGEYLDDSQVSGIQGIDEITVAQLLNHTSGIPNYDDDTRFAPMILNNPGSHITLEQKLNLVRNSGGRVPRWVIKKFGQIYSNTNYLLLQLIIEKATGMAYERYVRQKIIEPLNLLNTSFGSENAFPEGLSTGYVDFYGNGVMRNVHEWDAHRFDGEGDLISTAGDMQRFFQHLLSGQLIPAALVQQMKEQRLGLLQEEFELENAIGHDGIGIGYSAEMWYLPRSGLMVVVLSNQGRLVNENWSVLKYENLIRRVIEVGR